MNEYPNLGIPMKVCAEGFVASCVTTICCEVCARPDRGGFWPGRRRDRIQNSAIVFVSTISSAVILFPVSETVATLKTQHSFPQASGPRKTMSPLLEQLFSKNLAVCYLYELDCNKIKP